MITTSSAFKEIPWEDNNTVLLSIPRNQTNPKNPDFALNWDLSEIQNIFKSLCRSLVNVHRDLCILDDLSTILELLHDSVEKMKIECYRVGAIPKGTKVKIPSSANISSKFSL
jgi:hypothetical protein